jgi:type I restriction enzyme, S subunit
VEGHGRILKPEWVDEGVPTVRLTEMKTGTINICTLPRCKTERAEKFAKTTLVPRDLLISKNWNIGKTAFVPPELAGENITQHVMRFPICNVVDNISLDWRVILRFANLGWMAKQWVLRFKG